MPWNVGLLSISKINQAKNAIEESGAYLRAGLYPWLEIVDWFMLTDPTPHNHAEVESSPFLEI